MTLDSHMESLSLFLPATPTHIGEEDGLRVLTLRAEDKSLNESIEEVLKLGSVVGTIDDVAIILGVKLCLCTQLAAKVLARVCGGSEINVSILPCHCQLYFSFRFISLINTFYTNWRDWRPLGKKGNHAH